MIVFIAVLFLIVLLIERRSLSRAAKKIFYDIKISKTVLEQDEVFEIISTVTNRRKSSINYLRVSELFPSKIELYGDAKLESKSDVPGCAISSNVMFLPPRKSVERVIEASLPARGRYIFHGAYLVEGDFLGFREMTNTQSLYKEVVVLPKPYRSKALENMLGGLMGDYSVRRFIFEDPVLTLGYREYTGREPMKSISWAQSAKTGKLMVKNYDYTTEPTIAVILNIELHTSGFHMITKDESKLIERTLSIARTVCEYLNDRRISFSFTSNMMTAGGRRTTLSYNSAFGAAHLLSVLENLGRGMYDTVEPFVTTLYNIEKSARQGRANIIITPKMQDDYVESINRLKRLSGGCFLIEAERFTTVDD